MIEQGYKKQLVMSGNEDYMPTMLMIKDNKLYCVPPGDDDHEPAFAKPTMEFTEWLSRFRRAIAADGG